MEFDPYSRTFFEDPYEMYAWLREEQPVYYSEQHRFFALSRYEDCMEAHRDTATYTSTKGVSLDQLQTAAFSEIAESGIASIIMMDPPMHDRLRKLVNRAFTPRRIADWEPVVRRVIDGFLDRLDGATSFDVVADLAGPFPVEVISEILGVPAADRQQIRHWVDAMLEREVGNPFPTEAGMEGGLNVNLYMADLIAERRKHPADDMIGHLLSAEVEREDGTVERLTDTEVAQFITLMTSAGAETVTKLVGNGVVTFEQNPDQLAKLKADPELGSAAVEELLRFKAPSQYQGRFSVAERSFHGVTIPAGYPVLLVTGAANRDPRAFADPDRFDIERKGPPGIAFGHGIHFCIGAHLARLEGKVALEELYRRWPNLHADLDGVRYVQMANVAGPASVPVAA